MLPSPEFLDPSRPLAAAAADALWARRKADPAGGAASLAHLLVVVPTRRAGLRLRLALARRAGPGGLVPPRVVQQTALVVPAAETPRTASPAEAAASFLSFVRACAARGGAAARWPALFRPDAEADPRALLAFFARLEEVWNLLGAGGLRMRDVAARADALPEEAAADGARWAALADFEAAFFAFLEGRGLRHRAAALAAAKTAPKPLPEGVEEVVLPALVDPMPLLFDVLGALGVPTTAFLHAAAADGALFDAFGRPDPERWTGSARPNLPAFRDRDVVRAGTDADLARRLAADFPAAEPGRAPPAALGLCDPDLLPELSGAFFADRGLPLFDPDMRRLSETSLGRILSGLLALRPALRAGGRVPWADFVRVLREDDVLGAVSAGPENRAAALRGLNLARNAFLPVFLPDGAAFDEAALRFSDRPDLHAFEAAAADLLGRLRAANDGAADAAEFLRRAAMDLYRGKIRSGSADDRTFEAAVEAAREALAAFGGGVLADPALDEADRETLVAKALADAVCPPAPETGAELTAEGWVELAWSEAPLVALAGFREGAVPETVQGHVFLPDSLRRALGLPSNASRLARDTFLLKELLDARAATPGAVRAYVSLADAAGERHRPSRLLFLVPDADLAARTRALFGPLPAAETKPPRRVSPGWVPRLPERVPLPGRGGTLSASAIDAWLANPLGYLLGTALGMRRFEEKDELGADDFGSLVHKALENYAREQLARTARGEPQLSDEADVRAALLRHAAAVRACFGDRPPLRLRLQLDALEARLSAFAPVQAAWAQDGWSVFAAERRFDGVRPFAGDPGADVPFNGSADRIDVKAGVGFRVIDYKTWDEKAKAVGHVLSSGKAEAEHAAALGLPTLEPARKNAAPRRCLSPQLPLYGSCLEAADPATFADRIADLCYLVLGKDEKNVGVFGSAVEQAPFEAERKKSVVLTSLARFALDTARCAVRAIRENLFWPPGPGRLYDAEALFLRAPERDLAGSAWLAEQERRLAARKGGRP